MRLDQCPVCHSTDFQPLLAAKDYLVSAEVFSIAACNNCGLRFTNPRPDDHQLDRYYDSAAYISHSDQQETLTDKLYKIARGFTLKSKRRLITKINQHNQQARLLDVGCGTGYFLAACQQHGWQVSGVEPNDLARKQAMANTGITLYDDLQKITGQQFEIITLWHVLEHVPDLPQTLTKLKSLLAAGGRLLIAVPNYTAYEAGLFKEYWAAYDVPRHLYHFNRQAMHTLAAKHGLKVVQTYPMWLDSFYISLLSNQHKYNRQKYLNSFITGLLSNIYALKGGNFSSIIYQLTSDE